MPTVRLVVDYIGPSIAAMHVAFANHAAGKGNVPALGSLSSKFWRRLYFSSVNLTEVQWWNGGTTLLQDR